MPWLPFHNSPFCCCSTPPPPRPPLLLPLPLHSYWCRYWIGAWFELPGYALRRKRYGWAVGTVSAETLYLLAIALLWRVNPVATLWTLVVPFGISSFALMFGNWWVLAWQQC